MRNISWHFFNVKTALLGLSLICSTAGAADKENAVPSGEKAQAGSQLWLATGFRSYHFKRSAGYNETNTGIGFEWRFDDEHAVMAGVYDNSVHRTSHYLHYAWTPWHLGPLRLGGAAGLIDGYPELNDGNFSLALIPVATMDFKVFAQDVGINLVYIPTIASRIDGSLSLQLKMRLK